MLHDNLAHPAALNLILCVHLDVSLYLVDELFKFILSDRPLFKRFLQSALKFVFRVRFPPSVTFNDRQVQDFYFFIRREAKSTLEAFPTPSNSHPIVD